jgi:hypothetical protein
LYLGNAKQNALDMVSRKRSLVGEKHPNSKLSSEDVISIRREFDLDPIKHHILAKKYGVTRESIRDILNRKRWKHI